jgi:hypothetical protein
VLLVFNAELRPQACLLPPGSWRVLLDSSDPRAPERDLDADAIEAPAQSVLLLRSLAR